MNFVRMAQVSKSYREQIVLLVDVMQTYATNTIYKWLMCHVCVQPKVREKGPEIWPNTPFAIDFMLI